MGSLAMNKDDYSKARELVDIWKAETDPLELARQAGEVRKVGNVHFIYCPFHNDTGKPNLAVYPDGYKCFSCGWSGSVSDFIMKLNDWTFAELVDYIAGFQVDTRPVNTPKRATQPKEHVALPSALVARFQAHMTQQHYDYWEAQGIPRAVLDKFQVGHTGDRWAFPWKYRGVLMAYKLRRDDRLRSELEPKYISLKGSHYDAPYNIDSAILGDVPDIVLIQEDEKSTIAAACYGLVSISSPAGKWTQEWSEMIRHIPNIIIVANNDEPGLQAAHERQRMLRHARIVCLAPDKDLFDLHSRVWDIPGIRELMLEWLGLA